MKYLNFEIIANILFILALLVLLLVIVKIIKLKKINYKELCKLIVVALLMCFSLVSNYYNDLSLKKDNFDVIALEKEIIDINKTIYIGDSRTVGMYFSIYSRSYSKEIFFINENEIWYASVGKGYYWFKNDALLFLDDLLSKENYKVIIQMGTNDLENESSSSLYLKNIYDLSIKYKDSIFIFTNVGPIENQKLSYSVTNEDVIKYNEYLLNNFYLYTNDNIYIYDLYNNIINSFSSTDGVHYTKATYLNIYNLLNNVKL